MTFDGSLLTGLFLIVTLSALLVSLAVLVMLRQMGQHLRELEKALMRDLDQAETRIQRQLATLGRRLETLESHLQPGINTLTLHEKRLAALELLPSGLEGKKAADLLEAAAALRRDKSAAEARGVDLETYLEERKRRPPPPKPQETPQHVERVLSPERDGS